MPMCPPCREDDHDHHRGKFYLSWNEKSASATGAKSTSKNLSRQVDCTCAECSTKKDWRGAPTDLPSEPRYWFEPDWVQRNDPYVDAQRREHGRKSLHKRQQKKPAHGAGRGRR